MNSAPQNEFPGTYFFWADGFHFTIIQKLIRYTLTLIILNVTNFARCRRIPIRKVNITKFENATQDLKRGINFQQYIEINHIRVEKIVDKIKQERKMKLSG